MKTFAIVFAVCFVGAVTALNDEQKAKLKEFRDACITETGVELAKVNDAKAGNIDESSEKLACFSACLQKKIGVMNADGSFNEEVIRARAPSDVSVDKVNELFAKCKDVTGTNDCQKALKLFKCYMENKTFNVFD